MLQRFVDPAAVAAEIVRLRSLSGGALRRRWQAVFGWLCLGGEALFQPVGDRPRHHRHRLERPALLRREVRHRTGPAPQARRRSVASTITTIRGASKARPGNPTPTPWSGVTPCHRVLIGKATLSCRSSHAPSRFMPPVPLRSGFRFARSTARPATGCASNWSMRRPVNPSTAPTRPVATRSARASFCSSRTRNWRRSRSKAPTPSRSTASFRARRSTSATSTRPITSPPTIRSGRRPLRSSAKRCAARLLWHLGASCSPSASG